LTKSSDTAAFWYGKAADAGLAEAQRRLGMLLIKSHAADTDDYKSGINLLKAAGKQGDADATAKLKELGQ
jgi:TPR repeat protein